MWLPMHLTGWFNDLKCSALPICLRGQSGLMAAALSTCVLQEGRTALHWAASEGHTAAVRDLLRKGADPVSTDLVSSAAAPEAAGQHSRERSVGRQLLQPREQCSRQLPCEFHAVPAEVDVHNS